MPPIRATDHFEPSFAVRVRRIRTASDIIADMIEDDAHSVRLCTLTGVEEWPFPCSKWADADFYTTLLLWRTGRLIQ